MQELQRRIEEVAERRRQAAQPTVPASRAARPKPRVSPGPADPGRTGGGGAPGRSVGDAALPAPTLSPLPPSAASGAAGGAALAEAGAEPRAQAAGAAAGELGLRARQPPGGRLSRGSAPLHPETPRGLSGARAPRTRDPRVIKRATRLCASSGSAGPSAPPRAPPAPGSTCPERAALDAGWTHPDANGVSALYLESRQPARI